MEPPDGEADVRKSPDSSDYEWLRTHGTKPDDPGVQASSSVQPPDMNRRSIPFHEGNDGTDSIEDKDTGGRLVTES